MIRFRLKIPGSECSGFFIFMKLMKGICKLCKKEKDLIRKSHIFPNFMYKGIGDEKGRMKVVSSDRPYRPGTAQSGAHEAYMLCASCDNEILGSLERYASNHLYNRPYLKESNDFKQINIEQDSSIIECHNLEYKKFKLFLLSLLWRASIADEGMFVNFKLSEEEEEFLRSAIYEDAIVSEAVFPCILLTCENRDVETDFVGVDPFNAGMVKFYINEFVYTFLLKPEKIDDTTMQLTVKMDNMMTIMKVTSEKWNVIRLSIAAAAAKASKPNL